MIDATLAANHAARQRLRQAIAAAVAETARRCIAECDPDVAEALPKSPAEWAEMVTSIAPCACCDALGLGTAVGKAA
ncbi:MAG: hypothetical protein AAFV45_15320 [Pseudomonadota bacterium]